MDTTLSLKIYANLLGTNQFKINRASVIELLQYSVIYKFEIPSEYLGVEHNYYTDFHSILRSVLISVPIEVKVSGKWISY